MAKTKSLGECIATKDLKALQATVSEAVSIYGASQPKDAMVETVHGAIPFSAVWDEETKWEVIGGAYADVIQKASKIPEGVDRAIEEAKIIATNAVLRNVGEVSSTSAGGLI